MEHDEDYEIIPDHAPQASYLKSVGFSSLDFVSTHAAFGLESPPLEKNKVSYKASVCRIFCHVYDFLKEIFKPTSVYFKEVELIKHSGLLFKENVLLVQEFSQPFSSENERNYLFLKPLVYFNISIILPMLYVTLKAKNLASPPVLVFCSLYSVYTSVYLYRFYSRFRRCSSLKSLVLSFKMYNQKFLKSLQFISENDQKMMTNYSRLNKLVISGFNSFKVLDPSWLHFKRVVVESAVQSLQNLHALCRVLNELPALQEHLSYQSLCSVDFTELGVSEVDIDCHQVYLSFLNKLKLLLFLFESELLSFIAINLSEHYCNSGGKVSFIFSTVNDISTMLVNSSNSIEYYFNRFYTSGDQELLLKKDNLDMVDADLAKVFVETRALSHSTLSTAVQVRNLEKTLESKIQAPKLINKAQIVADLEEAVSNIEYELLSSQHKLKSLVRLLMLTQEPSSDSTHINGNLAKPMPDNNMEEMEKEGIEVGRSDFNPTEPDEVFVGISTDFEERTFDVDDDVSEDHLYALAFNRSSKKLIKELKVKLKDKKTEMVEREKLALQRKNIADLIEIDDLSSESSDDEEKSVNSDLMEAQTGEEILFDKIPSSHHGLDNVMEQPENRDSFEVKSERMMSLENCFPFNESSTLSESLEVNTNNTEADDGSKRALDTCSDISLGAERSVYNPLAMSITNISRAWNQELNRTEECFGSDSESSDSEI